MQTLRENQLVLNLELPAPSLPQQESTDIAPDTAPITNDDENDLFHPWESLGNVERPPKRQH